MNKRKYYQSKDGKSLYKFCLENNLNVYEFDLLKRLIREKNELDDLEKTLDLLDIYKNEFSKRDYAINYISDKKIGYFIKNWKIEKNYKIILISKILTLRTKNYEIFLFNIDVLKSIIQEKYKEIKKLKK